jgi:hypothetical protein
MRRFAPVLVLALLAIAVPEILFGSTPLSSPGQILVNLPIYAGGVVVIRELARRRNAGCPQVAMLGAAYGLIEEGLALGSIVNPDLFNAGLVGGRWLGVNWTWTEWTLGYHAVWTASIPILLAELLFPARRAEPWLGTIGLTVAGLIYLAGLVFMTLIIHLVVAPGYMPPVLPTVAIGLAVVGLGMVALGRAGAATVSEHAASATAATAARSAATADSAPEARAPSPWLVGLLTLLVAGAWFGLLLLPGPVKYSAWVLAPMALDLVLVGSVICLVRRWSGDTRGWTDLHRLALAAGPLPISMLWGLVYVTAGQPVARVSELVSCALAIGLVALLARHIHRRQIDDMTSGVMDRGAPRADTLRVPAR